MNWKSIRQPDIDIYRWSFGAHDGGGLMGVTLHPGPFSIHQERCMDRLNVKTRSESCKEKKREKTKVETDRQTSREMPDILKNKGKKNSAGIRLNI